MGDVQGINYHRRNFVRVQLSGGNFPRWELSGGGGVIVQRVIVVGGNCPEGKCPRGNGPRCQLSGA